MEKIRFAPLIEHLKEHAGQYNQLYSDLEMRAGSVDRFLLSKWIVHVVEPVVINTAEVSPDCISQVFKSFYTSLLSLLGSKLALTYENEYQQAWSICQLIPQLVASHPKRIINAINSALLSLRQYQPERVNDWINLMLKIAPQCQSVEAFLNCGRFVAWLFGMAHLRENALEVYPGLNSGIKEILESLKLSVPIDDLLKSHWGSTSQLEFKGVAAGFSGYGNTFKSPPLVAEFDGVIISSDGITSCALFADAMGSVIIRDLPINDENVRKKASVVGLEKLNKTDLLSEIDFKEITSCVILNSTLVITRSLSHYLFIYSYTETAK